MNNEFVIVGAGPAGLCAAIEAAKNGVEVLLIDDNDTVGGQLFLQTHKFFGSRDHMAGIRGFQIGEELLKSINELDVEVLLNATVWGIYPNSTVAFNTEGKKKESIVFKNLLIATGALEKSLYFKGWTKPGVMGAGAVQNMMHISRVKPGNNALVIGSGNVGLIVAYQLTQANVNVVGVIEALPKIGGYQVHAGKIRRLGIPILTNYTIIEAKGNPIVESVVVAKVDKNFKVLPGSEIELVCDLVCLATGLKPFDELCYSADLKISYIENLNSFVVLHDDNMETSRKGIYVAGDITGVEEASTAMDEGRLVGIEVARKLGKIKSGEASKIKKEISGRLENLRIGTFGKERSMGKRDILKKFKNLIEGE